MSGQEKPPSGPVPYASYQASFGAGELTPKLQWRSDLAKWKSGAALMSNMFAHVQGGASNRPGTEYVGSVKFPSDPPRLIPFMFNASQTYMLEVGNQYIRFISNGAYIQSGGGPLEITTPYQSVDVPTLRYAQSADVMTITHPGYPPADLKRTGATSFTYGVISFGSSIGPPGTVVLTANAGTAASAGTTPGIPFNIYSYVVTANQISSSSESVASAICTGANYNISYYPQYGCYNTISWTTVTGADFYNIYKEDNGVFGFMGSTTLLTFNDTNIAANTTHGPPNNVNPFTGGNNPACVAYFQQRRVFAGGNDNPQTLWFSRSGNYTNFDVSTPVLDDDAITVTLAAQAINPITHLQPLQSLLVMTYGGCFRLSAGGTTAALTPSDTTVAQQVFLGASALQPIPVNYDVLYGQAKGGAISDLTYNFYADLYTSSEISTMAEHLFYGYEMAYWDWAETPFKTIWVVRTDGGLISLTWLKEQEIYAWSQHTTQGSYKAVAVVPETYQGVTEDVPYFVVQRTIGGNLACFVERMFTRLLNTNNTDITSAWFVDAGLRYVGTATTTVTGLDHLDGQAVVALANGIPVMNGLTVSGGSVTIPFAATTILVGLQYTCELQTLPLNLGQQEVFGDQKRISRLTVMLQNSAGAQYSTDNGARITSFPGQKIGATTPALFTGTQQAYVPGYWDRPGQINIYQQYPLPLTVLGVVADIEVGSA